MKRAYFNTGEIIEGRQCVVKRAIKLRKKYDRYLKYKFTGPFSQLEECVYELRSQNPWLMFTFFDRYPMSVIERAEAIIKGVQ